MATTDSGDSAGAVCPLCKDYEGQPASVEAHISRLQDDDHKGEVGRGHRDDLLSPSAGRADLEEMSDISTQNEGDTPDSVQASEATSAGSENGEGVSGLDPASAGAATGAVAAPALLGEVDTKVLVAGVVLVVVVAYLMVSGDGSSERQPGEVEEPAESDEFAVFQEGSA